MGNKVATFTEQQLEDYQVSNQIFLLKIIIFLITGLYFFHSEGNLDVSCVKHVNQL